MNLVCCFSNSFSLFFVSMLLVDLFSSLIQSCRFSFSFSLFPSLSLDFRQPIADTWPRVFDDSAARRDWAWKHHYDLDAMTVDMLEKMKSVKLRTSQWYLMYQRHKSAFFSFSILRYLLVEWFLKTVFLLLCFRTCPRERVKCSSGHFGISFLFLEKCGEFFLVFFSLERKEGKSILYLVSKSCNASNNTFFLFFRHIFTLEMIKQNLKQNKTKNYILSNASELCVSYIFKFFFHSLIPAQNEWKHPQELVAETRTRNLL